MQNITERYLRSVNRPIKRYNILTAPTHERYQTNLGSMSHHFYMIQHPGFVKWKSHQTPIPANHTLFDGPEPNIPHGFSFDMILSQNRFGQYQVFQPLSEQLNLPMIQIEHTLPVPSWTKKMIQQMTKMRGHLNVFISEYSVDKWGYNINEPDVRIIRHGCDAGVFKPSHNWNPDGKILVVANDFVGRRHLLGFDLYQQITKGLPTNPIGDTKGFSKPAPSLEALVENYQNAGVFLNTSLVSPLPTALLEAAACGCPIVTTSNCAIPELIQDGYNGFAGNDPDYLKDRLIWCLKNPTEAKKLGDNARRTVLAKFSLDSHIKSWHSVFEEAERMIFN